MCLFESRNQTAAVLPVFLLLPLSPFRSKSHTHRSNIISVALILGMFTAFHASDFDVDHTLIHKHVFMCAHPQIHNRLLSLFSDLCCWHTDHDTDISNVYGTARALPARTGVGYFPSHVANCVLHTYHNQYYTLIFLHTDHLIRCSSSSFFPNNFHKFKFERVEDAHLIFPYFMKWLGKRRKKSDSMTFLSTPNVSSTLRSSCFGWLFMGCFRSKRQKSFQMTKSFHVIVEREDNSNAIK